jgi:hypothetical protein
MSLIVSSRTPWLIWVRGLVAGDVMVAGSLRSDSGRSFYGGQPRKRGGLVVSGSRPEESSLMDGLHGKIKRRAHGQTVGGAMPSGPSSRSE